MKLDPEILRQAMRFWTTGVTIVCSMDGDKRHGMTVSSFTSISLEPPLVLVSLSNGSKTSEMALHSGCFGVSILDRSQQELSERFSGRIPDTEDRFVGIETETLSSGVSFIKGSLAFLDCRVITSYPAGTNTLLIGEVVAARSAGAGDPLVYYDRTYRQLGGGAKDG